MVLVFRFKTESLFWMLIEKNIVWVDIERLVESCTLKFVSYLQRHTLIDNLILFNNLMLLSLLTPKCDDVYVHVYITFDDCNCKLRVKEQYKLKAHVTVHTENHLLKIDFGGSFSGFASRSLAAWPALARRFGRIARAKPPTYTVGNKTNRHIQL